MKTYWDSDALLDAILGVDKVYERFQSSSDKVTRCHTFAETFSHLTGGRIGGRLLPDDAARIITEFARQMTIVSLTEKQTLEALKQTRKRGVRGGGIHDFLHIYAAEIHGCDKILTGNISDFEAFTDLPVEAP